ncbi:superinfection immunity protein [Novosphingobium sp.]|uniref:superinfection immunity protein n=1 Tax=Novosphingobium sp. TaxID=1874826 RepID=UPI003BACD691
MSLSLPHLIVLLIVLPLSFAPTIIAFSRKHAKKWLVLALNLLAGWTGIGWILALIWAIIGKPANAETSTDGVF